MKNKNGLMIFQTRKFYNEIPISSVRRQKIYKDYLGNESCLIEDRETSTQVLSSIISRLQEELVDWIKSKSPHEIINKLYKIHDECYRFYDYEKEVRGKIIDSGIDDKELNNAFSTNRNIVINIINSVNLWLENCLLFQDELGDEYDNSFQLDEDLLLKMALYGTVSRALSLINLSRKFGSKTLFYGVKIDPLAEDPVEPLRYHPVLYFNPILTGNQHVFDISIEEYKNADKSEFGVAFCHIYGIDFILALRTMRTLQTQLLRSGKYAYTVISKEHFINWVTDNTNGEVNGEIFFDAFVLTHEKIKSQKKENEPIIWLMGTNRHRHEICPFLCTEDDRIAISYTALDQCIQLWMSIFGNASMAYSTPRSKVKDELTLAIENRATYLSKKLVEILREKLRTHYIPRFDEIDVRYDRIFGKKEKDYGDYDLVFYSEETNELFLIEAKYFSDSLNNSGMITDYEKLFNDKGYYSHCRDRYNLVIQEGKLMKKHIGVDIQKTVNVHFLFVSSKPLELELQDDDGIVTFLCLSKFDDYLEGRLLPEVGDDPVRPVYSLITP